MKKALVGFSGFGGVEIALSQAGFEVIGIEIEPAIAEVARLNGHNTITADLLDIDPREYIGYDLMQFSPPCLVFSSANYRSNEGEGDLALAKKVARFIVVSQPAIFVLENVWAYRHSQSWSIINEALIEMGYGVDFWHLNSADYGVPQTRKRMIAIGRRDGKMPEMPFPTHSKNPDFFTTPWVGWFSAVEDLIDGLPDSEFAPWQWERLPQKMRTLLVPNEGIRLPDQPMGTITASSHKGTPRAFIIGQGQRSSLKPGGAPVDTITANSNQTGIKAFVVGGQYQTPNNGQERVVQNRAADQPIWTIVASENGDTRGHVESRTVSMTPRCLARFQGFPDWYVLPANRKLACRGIGNAVPPAVMAAVIESLRQTNVSERNG